MKDSEEKNTRRISVDLPKELVDQFDQLKTEWGLRARGAVLKRLLEELLPDYNENIVIKNDINSEKKNSEVSLNNNKQVTNNYDENKAIVLIRSGHSNNSTTEEDIKENNKNKDSRVGASSTGGIDLPGFVRKRAINLKVSLNPRISDNNQDPLVSPISHEHLIESLKYAENHWLAVYGQKPKETVVEAAMIWIARDIWPQLEGVDGTPFTWTAANLKLNQFCPSWKQKKPTLENILVLAGALEDPFGTAKLSERMPTLIRRFVNRFKKSQNVNSFQTIESTMTVHGALKLLELPTTAGAALTLNRIREAYKTKALMDHPDAGGSTDSMRRINEAYQLLKELYRN